MAEVRIKLSGLFYFIEIIILNKLVFLQGVIRYICKWYLYLSGIRVSYNMNEFDSIIIGSGAGGLSAAICLAKAGQKVAVIEQH